MNQQFQCSACNAAQPQGPFDSESIRCAYCGSMVVVPEALRIVPVRLPPGFSLGRISEGELLLHAAEINRIVYWVQHGQSREAMQLFAQTFRLTPWEAKRDLALLLAAIANPKRAAESDPASRFERTVANSASRTQVTIISNRPPETDSRGGRGLLAFVLIVAILTTLYYSLFGGKEMVTQLLNGGEFPFAQLSEAIQGESLAKSTLQFGSEGIGAGQFSDATAIAVDTDGNIYVAEGEGGRVQIFDATGTFQTQWFLPSKERVLKMAADRQGALWVLQGARLTSYQAQSGEPSQTVAYGLVSLASDFAIPIDNSLLAAFFSGDDELVRFNDDLQPVRAYGQIISEQLQSPGSMPHIAIDGMETIYVLAGSTEVAILKFDANGKFLDRIENREDDGERFWTLSQIAVDGKGHLFVTARDGVLVLESNGTYLGKIRTAGYPANLAVSDQDELFVVTAKQVTKYVLESRS